MNKVYIVYLEDGKRIEKWISFKLWERMLREVEVSMEREEGYDVVEDEEVNKEFDKLFNS